MVYPMPSKKVVQAAWEKAASVRGRDPATWRRDEEGNLIRAASYGTQGEYGWEVDHRKPVAKGGTDDPCNLRALHTTANREKSDKY
jgi:hypothetical protein